MAASIRFWWFIEHVRDGITRTFGSLASCRQQPRQLGQRLPKPLEALSIPPASGRCCGVRGDEPGQHRLTQRVRRSGRHRRRSIGRRRLTCTLVCKKDATTNLPTSLATNGVWQRSAGFPAAGSTSWRRCSLTGRPTTARAQDGDFPPSATTPMQRRKLRVYRLAVYNPGTEAVVVNTLIG